MATSLNLALLYRGRWPSQSCCGCGIHDETANVVNTSGLSLFEKCVLVLRKRPAQDPLSVVSIEGMTASDVMTYVV